MVYPIPNPNLPFLGIHLTRTVNNKIILLLVLLVLYVVAFSSLLLLKFIIENKQNNSLIWKLSVIGGIQFVFHTLIIDAVYWGWNFI